DILTLIKDITPDIACNAAKHGFGVHDKVVVLFFREEIVGEEDTEALENATTLNITGDHRDLGLVLWPGTTDEGGKWCIRQHRLDPRHQSRIGAVLDDL